MLTTLLLVLLTGVVYMCVWMTALLFFCVVFNVTSILRAMALSLFWPISLPIGVIIFFYILTTLG